MKPSNSPLKVSVTNDQLSITIGVNTLAYALQNGPEPFGAQIKDAKKFAKDIVAALQDGDEGGTPIEQLLEQMGQDAIENGSQHVHLDGDPEPSVYPPEHS